MREIKKRFDVELHLHCHSTTGMAEMALLKAVEAGVDGIDTAISSMSGTYGHPATESLVATLQGTEYDTGLDIPRLEKIAAYFRNVRKKYAKFEGQLRGVDSRILVAQVPGGMLTNFQTVAKRVVRMKELEEMDFDDVRSSGLTKKELLLLEREKDKLVKQLGGIRNMDRTPSAMFVVDINKEALAVEEAHKLGIPVVALVDTNTDPDSVDYQIPANDDAIRAIELLTALMADAVAEGLIARGGKGANAAAAQQPLAEWETELLKSDAANEAAPAQAAPEAEAAQAE
ncbi:MAG: 30S ribosomal protein S2 [Alloscardovia omnicolens]|nr:30S ribosomal protein S2 [Alloscardovia omnicolens]